MKNLKRSTISMINTGKNTLIKNYISIWNPYHQWMGKMWTPAVAGVLYPFIEL